MINSQDFLLKLLLATLVGLVLWYWIFRLILWWEQLPW